MKDERYPWDTPERQGEKKPYNFIEFPEDFLDHYLEKRERIMKSFGNLEEVVRKVKPIPLEQMRATGRFETSEVISGISSSLAEGSLNESELLHFWRLLKKVELKKLKRSYGIDFRNASVEDVYLEDLGHFSLTLGRYAQSKGEGYMQAASTLLKLNDFLISRMGDLGGIERRLLSQSLAIEREIVLDAANSNYDDNFHSAENDMETSTTYTPKKVMNFGMILQKNNRSRAYIQNLLRNGLLPNFVLILNGHSSEGEKIGQSISVKHDYPFSPEIPEEQSLTEAGVEYRTIEAKSFNDEAVIQILRERTEKYFGFSGMEILKEVLDSGKHLIHVHPGKLPEYRGSTCPYYSILQRDGWWCTSFVMDPRIDEGYIASQRRFPLPRGTDTSRIYDPFTRSEVLVDTVRQLAEKGELEMHKQDLSQGIDYYVIHPVLEFIAKRSLKG